MSKDSVNRQKQTGSKGQFGHLVKGEPANTSLTDETPMQPSAPIVATSLRNKFGRHTSVMLAGLTEEQQYVLREAFEDAIAHVEENLDVLWDDEDEDGVRKELSRLNDLYDDLYGDLYGPSANTFERDAIERQWQATNEVRQYAQLRDIAEAARHIHPDAAYLIYREEPGHRPNAVILCNEDGDVVFEFPRNNGEESHQDIHQNLTSLTGNERPVVGRFLDQSIEWSNSRCLDLNKAANAGAPE